MYSLTLPRQTDEVIANKDSTKENENELNAIQLSFSPSAITNPEPTSAVCRRMDSNSHSDLHISHDEESRTPVLSSYKMITPKKSNSRGLLSDPTGWPSYSDMCIQASGSQDSGRPGWPSTHRFYVSTLKHCCRRSLAFATAFRIKCLSASDLSDLFNVFSTLSFRQSHLNQFKTQSRRLASRQPTAPIDTEKA